MKRIIWVSAIKLEVEPKIDCLAQEAAKHVVEELRKILCPECHGKGKAKNPKKICRFCRGDNVCPDCKGRGEKSSFWPSYLTGGKGGGTMYHSTCPSCSGTGVSRQCDCVWLKCNKCNGSGLKPDKGERYDEQL